MNDKCEPPVPKKSLLLYVELFYKKYAEKIEKMCPHFAKCKNALAMRKRPKNTAHAEKPKKCGIFVRRTIAFFPRL